VDGGDWVCGRRVEAWSQMKEAVGGAGTGLRQFWSREARAGSGKSGEQ
jgi:hypothetical protein